MASAAKLLLGCLFLLLAGWSALATLARYERKTDLIYGGIIMVPFLAAAAGFFLWW